MKYGYVFDHRLLDVLEVVYDIETVILLKNESQILCHIKLYVLLLDEEHGCVLNLPHHELPDVLELCKN